MQTCSECTSMQFIVHWLIKFEDVARTGKKKESKKCDWRTTQDSDIWQNCAMHFSHEQSRPSIETARSYSHWADSLMMMMVVVVVAVSKLRHRNLQSDSLGRACSIMTSPWRNHLRRRISLNGNQSQLQQFWCKYSKTTGTKRICAFLWCLTFARHVRSSSTAHSVISRSTATSGFSSSTEISVLSHVAISVAIHAAKRARGNCMKPKRTSRSDNNDANINNTSNVWCHNHRRL